MTTEPAKRIHWFAFIAIAILWPAAGRLEAASPSDEAHAVLEASGVEGGLIVHVGCGDGRLTAALKANSRFTVHGLDGDPANVAKARGHIRTLGLYGPVSVMRCQGRQLPYADNMVNLLVAHRLGEVPADEVLRVLVPDGVALVREDVGQAFRLLGQAGRLSYEILSDGWTRIVKPRPETIDEWTHWLHGPDGNAVARDSVAGPPRLLQWMAGPLWARHHDTTPSVSTMVSSGGRVFYIVDEAPAGVDGRIADKWFLIARDAFNGMLLWKRPMPDWGWKQWTVTWHSRNNEPVQLPKRLVAVGDRVYVTLGFNAPVTALDAANGEILTTYAGTEFADEILCHDGRLVLSLNSTAHKPTADNHEPLKKTIAAVDADTGAVLWKTGDYTGLLAKSDSIEPVGRLEMAVGDGRVFFSDSDAIVALDLQTGREVWRAQRTVGPKLPANFSTRMYELSVLVYNDGVVLFLQPEGTISFHSVPGTLCAFNAEDGRLLWKHGYGGWVHNTQPNAFVIDGTVWIHEHLEGAVKAGKRMVLPAELQKTADYAVLGLDLHTGEQKHRFSTRETFDVGHHHRCYRNKATERFLLTSRRGVEYIDVASGENHLHHWVRGACLLGVMPCNGLLYSTPHPCDCYIEAKLNGFYCLAPEGGRRVKSGEQSDGTSDITGQLERGPAFGGSGSLPSALAPPPSTAWSTFRADPRRSGSTASHLSSELDPG